MAECYRCGWCGNPTNEDGRPLSIDQIMAWDDADWDNATPLYGQCCPNGDGPTAQDARRADWEHEMRMDAFGEV